jgi:formylglycine-generating enzyme required for sulfatase activity
MTVVFPRARSFRTGLPVAVLLWLACAMVLAPSPAGAQQWQPNYDLRLRPDGPGLDSIPQPDGPEASLLDGPASPDAHDTWLSGLRAWRKERKTAIGYHDDMYRQGGLDWARRIFTQAQLLAWDRSLYDPVKGAYTPDRALAGLTGRFGPIDSVLIWPAYPNLGLDGRNQFDLVRDLPGGVPALRTLVADFHRRGVRVFFPVLDWDGGTRDAGVSRAREAAGLLREIGADGINFDTLNAVPEEASDLAAATEPRLALEPQFSPQNASLAASAISWNDWVLWDDMPAPFVPRVSLVKWLEPRHMVEVTDRYPAIKANSLQHAFFNGQGVAILENLWGFWNGFSPRDAEAVKRFTRIERATADLLASPDWEPHWPVLQPGVFASRFPSQDRTLWTFVNRNPVDVDGEQLSLPVDPAVRYYDLWHGREMTPAVRNGQTVLSFAIESLGYGAVLAVRGDGRNPALSDLLRAASKDRAPLEAFSPATQFAPQTMEPIAATPRARTAPPGMVEIPAADFDFRVSGIEIENGNNPGVDVQFPWESSPRRDHRHLIHVARFFIDRAPVTNAAFKTFLDAAHYHPRDDHNFLRDWTNGAFPDGWADKPVTWVSIEDARAYAAWAGKRLPHVWEWQYAAQGTDGRAFPWGAAWNPNAVPAIDRSRAPRPPTDVNAFPAGASPFGVLDMEGNVAQWTDAFSDAHTRAAILRGGDYYRPAGSFWYFPKSYRLDEQEKYLLVAPGRDRSGVVGFRCVKDAAPG